MTLFSFLCMFIFLLLSLKILSVKDNRGVYKYAPLFYFYIYYLFASCYVFFVINDHSLLPERVLMLMSPNEIDNNIIRHILATIVFLLFVAIGFFVSKRINISNKRYKYIYKMTKSYRKLTVLLFFLFLLLSYVKISVVGGLIFLINNLDSRTTITAGTGYISVVTYVISILCLIFSTLNLKNNNNKRWVVFHFVIIFVIVLMELFYGGRKTPIIIIIFSMLLYNVYVKKIRIICFSNVFIFFLIFVISVSLPLFRTNGALDFYLSSPSSFFYDALSNSMVIFKRLTDIDRSIYIYHIFDNIDFWYGKQFLGIFYGMIPRSFFYDKPPIDEGVYIYNIAIGNNVEPLTPLRFMYPSGWPLTTITSAYASFGYFAIPIFAFIVGVLIAIANNYYLSTESPIALFLLFNIIIGNFDITVLRIVNTISVFLFMLTIMYICRIFFKNKG
ncbi:O-antigen polymerase [Photobacterium damselae]